MPAYSCRRPAEPGRARSYALRWRLRAAEIARLVSLVSCFSRRVWRLSYSFLPLASAISTLTRPSLKYSASGTIVWPVSPDFDSSLSISARCISNLRFRLAEWLVQVPCTYSGTWMLCSHASPRSIWTKPSTREARPSRSDLTSVPMSTRPHS